MLLHFIFKLWISNWGNIDTYWNEYIFYAIFSIVIGIMFKPFLVLSIIIFVSDILDYVPDRSQSPASIIRLRAIDSLHALHYSTGLCGVLYDLPICHTTRCASKEGLHPILNLAMDNGCDVYTQGLLRAATTIPCG